MNNGCGYTKPDDTQCGRGSKTSYTQGVIKDRQFQVLTVCGTHDRYLGRQNWTRMYPMLSSEQVIKKDNEWLRNPDDENVWE